MTNVNPSNAGRSGQGLVSCGIEFCIRNVFHAAGPGHGKAVVSSYMLANEVAAKRGIMLSFRCILFTGHVTAISAIANIYYLFLRGTGIRTDNLTGYLEITSYFCVMLLGVYLALA